MTYTNDGGEGELTLTVDPATGAVKSVTKTSGGDATLGTDYTVTVDSDSEFAYQFQPGQKIEIGRYTYTAPSGSSVMLYGRGEGKNPAVVLEDADDTVDVALAANKDTKTTYTAANASTAFAMSANDTDTTKVDLLDNKDYSAATDAGNSALKFTGRVTHAVNGVTYTGSATSSSYTVTYSKTNADDNETNANTVSVDSGSKVTATLNRGMSVRLSGAVGDKSVTNLPFTATNNGASIVIDNTSNGNRISGGYSGLSPIKDQDGDIVGYRVTRYPSGSSGSSVGVQGSKNGKVVVTPSSAAKNTTVTITVTPDAGYRLDKLTVTDRSGNELTLTRKSENVFTFIMPGTPVTVVAAFVEAAGAPRFKAVPTNAYYYDAVLWAIENEITNGISADLFGSNDPCTRAHGVTFLYCLMGVLTKTGTRFSDVVSGSYYESAVNWAVADGVTNGTTDTTFSPDSDCTRAQLVTFLYRAMVE